MPVGRSAYRLPDLSVGVEGEFEVLCRYELGDLRSGIVKYDILVRQRPASYRMVFIYCDKERCLVGEKRIGLALSDPNQSLAHPLATFTRRSGKRFPMKQLRAQLDEHRPKGLVLGLPLTANGSDSEWTEQVRTIGHLIAEKTGLPVVFWDERMTTARALSAIRDLGGGTRGRKDEIDQLAATTMLQAYLDSRKT